MGRRVGFAVASLLALTCLVVLYSFGPGASDVAHVAYTKSDGAPVLWHSRVDAGALVTLYLPVGTNMRQPVQRFPPDETFTFEVSDVSVRTCDGRAANMSALVEYRVCAAEAVKSPDMDYGLFLYDAVTSHLRTVMAHVPTRSTRTCAMFRHEMAAVAADLPLVLDGLLNIVEIRPTVCQ